jgi:NAD(P)-dependent dehydrogenase (short-subunit alcohol dehydrogenase family)
MPVAEFESPDAADTTVLVTGATGRVGRVLVRKLLLRGYKVRALVRQREAGGEAGGGGGSSEKEVGGGISGSSSSSADTEAIPQSAELVFGDVGDYKACRRAVEGVDKVGGCSGRCGAIKHNAGITWQGTLRHFDANLRSLPASLLVGFRPALKHSPPPCTLLPARLQVICCSAARSTITADLSRVEEKGVANLAAAFQDAQNAAARQQGRLSAAAKREVVDFADANYHEAWDITAVGVPAQGEQLRASWLPEPAASRFLGPVSLVPRSTPCLSGPKATCLLASLSPPGLLPCTLTHPPFPALPACRGECGRQDEGAAARGRAHARP